jgi:putative hydrolase of the HAD superfamily
MSIRALLIDLDDTLYDERTYVLSGFRAVAAAIARAYPHVDGAAMAADLSERLNAEGRGKLFDGALAAARIDPTPDLIAHLVGVYRDHHPDISLWPGVAETLAELRKGYRLAVVTDGLHLMQRRKAEALELASLVDAVVFCWEHEAPKPDPAGYRVALRKLDTEPADAVVIGDNPLHDMAAARAIRARSIRVRTGRYAKVDPARFRPDVEAQNFSGVPDALARIEAGDPA